MDVGRATEQDIHSDTIHFNSQPSGLMCGVWVAMEDMDNGPLVYYPRSHQWPEVTMQEVEAAGYFARDAFDGVLTFGNR